jgi:hypothetical protein
MDTAHYINQNLEYPSYPTRINRENELKFSEQPTLLVKKYFATKCTKINSKQLKGDGFVKSPKRANSQISHLIISIGCEIEI